MDTKDRQAGGVLRSEAAFVVQFSDATSFARSEVAGRVEHVRSGRATRFASLEQLLAFLASELERSAIAAETGSVSEGREEARR